MAARNVATQKEAALVAEVAESVFSGKLAAPRRTMEPTAKDWNTLRRISGYDRDQWEQAMAEKLATLSDKLQAKMQEKLEEDAFKTGELAYALSVSEASRNALSGRVSLAGASVNVQINNYGADKSRAQIVAELYGEGAKVVSNDSGEDVI